jgi:hypothetical protein
MADTVAGLEEVCPALVSEINLKQPIQIMKKIILLLVCVTFGACGIAAASENSAPHLETAEAGF